ncbi:MAG: hypothetical protein AMXMBFR58_27360 [Phycisphaerae bacterium]
MATVTIPLGKDQGTMNRTLNRYVHLTEDGKLHVGEATGAWLLFNDVDGRTLVRIDAQKGRRENPLIPMLHMFLGALTFYLGMLLN